MNVGTVLRIEKNVKAIDAGFNRLLLLLGIASILVFLVGTASAIFALAVFQADTGIDIPAGGGIVTMLVLMAVGGSYLALFTKIVNLQELAINAIRPNSN